MKRFWISPIVAAALVAPARAQKVEVQRPDRTKIIHVQTALNHLTILEMNELVDTVAVGSPVFRVEWRGHRVFIKPTEPNVATNLFVWTKAGRFNYELDPPGAVPEMVFAIDQPSPSPSKVTASPSRGGDAPEASPADVLLAARPIRLDGSLAMNNHIAVLLTDSIESNGQIFIRYTIRNGTNQAYLPGKPQAWTLDDPRYQESLYVLAPSQLGFRETARLKWRGQTSLEVAKSEIRSSRIEPGQESAGIVAVKAPLLRTGPWVLELVFLAGPKGPVTATVVL